MDINQKIELLKPYSELLQYSKMGLEKEGLRVSERGGISQAPHPSVLGSPLTNPYITTDFSESLIEIITPPLKTGEETLSFLENTQMYLYNKLPTNQSFWHSSMPCVIRGETCIPIAKYGKSNLAQMKTTYRRGLANRYGRVMQTIAGIHFNYSFSQDFWKKYHSILLSQYSLRDFIDHGYMCMSRNVIRYGWLIPYLFGASPAVCKSFLKGYHKHSMEEFNATTFFEPDSTSLRMGDIGYQNLREDVAGVKANYNSVEHYIHSLKAGMQTSSVEYEKIGIKNNGIYQQLNTNILQIENEYYASVRPKPSPNIDKKPLDALRDNGIEYIELRSLDINPLVPLGIDLEQVNFLESFLLFCLLDDSPLITTREQNDIDKNDKLVAHKGREYGLTLIDRGEQKSLQDWGLDLVSKINICAALFSDSHDKDVSNIAKRIRKPSLTTSAILLKNMRDNNLGFFDYIDSLSKQYRSEFLSSEIDKKHFKFLDEQVDISLTKLKEIEQSDDMSFDEFLENYYKK